MTKAETTLYNIRGESTHDQPVLDRIEFGFKMRELRKRKGKTIAQVAKACHVSNAMISYFENGHKMISQGDQLSYVKECLTPSKP